jgi:hypothetical protein
MNNKKIIIAIAGFILIVLWYFFAPIKWTFGLRLPKNYQECVNAGGGDSFKQGDSFGSGKWVCFYKDKSFSIPLNPLLKN